MNFLLKNWEKIFAISGLVFYTGAWFQRSGAAAAEAASQEQLNQLQAIVVVLTANEQKHDVDIQHLIDITAAIQDQQQTYNKGHH